MIIDTTLETGCGKSKICKFIKKGYTKPIIEVGNTYQIKGKLEKIVILYY
ncbi:unnamed protein product [Paramecium sonneborni]|uniref:Uncharacterized protein n=1 Tax=Paramecium sonneborni TaxID=65129 RepID=A0A8S1RV17_9CILI|nr:unnamed protein product [Paramecium sonneborni]